MLRDSKHQGLLGLKMFQIHFMSFPLWILHLRKHSTNLEGNDSYFVLIRRTQNEDVVKRYPTKELQDYQMKNLVAIRGRLETMTIIENWWKEQADNNNYYSRFSKKEFHGLTECIDVDSKTLDSLIKHTISVANADSNTSKVVTNIN